MLNVKAWQPEIVNQVVGAAQDEAKSICSTKNPSILRDISKSAFENLNLELLQSEFETRIPIIFNFVAKICNQTKAYKRAATTICSLMMFSRCKHMSAFATKTGLILRQCGLSTAVSTVFEVMHMQSL